MNIHLVHRNYIQRMDIHKRKLLGHFLFWAVFFLFYISSSTSRESFAINVETTLFKLPLLILAAYSFNYWQVPKYLNQKKYVAFAVSMVLIIGLLVILFRIMGYYYLDKFCVDGPYPFLSFEDFPLYMLSFHFPGLILYFYRVNKEQQKEREQLFALENEKVSTELKYLKAQLNPHFLFNTLNNLYSYVITKSPKAPDMVLQLSEILDYILYKSQQKYVSLEEEVKTIENYISLEQIRYGNRLKLDFEKEILKNTIQISPLLLVSMVENAFKHGVSGSIQKPEVRIKLKQFNKALDFSIWNTKTENNNKIDEYKTGIGLANIQRQLDLIYPEKHVFITREENTSFILQLKLKLT